jgi:putative glutamine amidotransferase
MKPRIAIPVPHSDREYADAALPKYVQAVEQAGGEAVVIPLELSQREIARLAASCHGVLLPGSRADIHPEKYGARTRHPMTAAADEPRADADELLLQDAFNMRKPILGVCYGMQSLNVWRSGTLVQHLESPVNHRAERTVARAHRVRLEADSRLGRILGAAPSGAELWVNSSHHQAVEEVGDGLRAVAWAEDGVVEAVEGVAPGQFVLAVQWHPERTFAEDENARSIFRAFLDAASAEREHFRAAATDFESVEGRSGG